MINKNIYLTAGSGFILGLLISFVGVIFAIPYANLPPKHFINEAFGIKKPIIIGFTPFWLFSKINRNYRHFLTDYAYFSLTVNPDGTIKKLANRQEEDPGWTNLRNGKFRNTYGLIPGKDRTSLVIAMSSEEDIDRMMESPVINADTLAKEVIPIVNQYKFRDVNIDIESFLEASPEKRAAFTRFLQAFSKKMRSLPVTLTIDISPSVLINNFLIDPYILNEIIDYVILMTYDYHYLGSFNAGPVAPVKGAGVEREFDVDSAVKRALMILPAEKIILGIPLYGYEYETATSDPGSPAIPGGAAVASSRRVADIIKNCPECIIGRGKLNLSPWLIIPNEKDGYYDQIFYEDEKSITEKIALSRRYNLAGIALWAVGYDSREIMNPLEEYKKSFKINNRLRPVIVKLLPTPD